MGDDWHPSSSSPNLDIGFIRGVVVQAVCGSVVVRTHHEKKATAKKRGVTSSRQRFYLAMSTILALEALVFTDSTPFMQPSFDS